MKVKAVVWCICVFAGIGQLTAQQAERKLLQFTGIIHNADTNAIVPYASLVNISFKNQQHAANHQGFFSFVAHEGDTIRLSAIGYREQFVIIPQTGRDKYTAVIRMAPESINLPELFIHPFPWASIDEFNQEFMNMKIADDEIMLAKKNLTKESLTAMAKAIPRNAEEMHAFTATQNHIQLSNKTVNQYYANPLFSPFAWGNFINQIVKGNQSRSKDD